MPRRNKTQEPVRIQYVKTDCSHKRRYTNEAAALNQAELQMLQTPHIELSVYRCELCTGWHLTSKRSQS